MEPTLVVDNGSYNVKMGLASSGEGPLVMPNCILRTKDKKVVLGDQLDSLQDISQVQIRRPFENGQLTSMELQKQIWDHTMEQLEILGLSEMNLVLGETPLQLPQLSKMTDQIVFEEYGFKLYYKLPMLSFAPWNVEQNNKLLGDSVERPYNDFQLVVDSGFNCTWVVPMIQGLVYWKGVKKLNIGGRMLSGLLREFISFRYYDVTEETILVNNIKENSCFVAEDYNKTIAEITQLRNGSANQDLVLEYVLPDFKTTTKGYVLTEQMKQQLNIEDLQILKLYDERISIPEFIFHPEIGNLDKPGLISTIISSIRACPELAQPLLAANIVLAGGNFNMEGFKPRILENLKSNLPQDWNIRIALSDEPSTYLWQSACKFAENGFDKVCITKEEYMEKGVNVLKKFKPQYPI